jgi:hypothetical protein
MYRCDRFVVYFVHEGLTDVFRPFFSVADRSGSIESACFTHCEMLAKRAMSALDAQHGNPIPTHTLPLKGRA